MAQAPAQREMIPADELDQRVAELVEQRLAGLKDVVAKASPGAEGQDLAAIIQSMAMAIANVSDQGTGRKRVAPEEIVRREEARVVMFRLIDEANETGTAPEYQLRHLVYLKEQKVNPVWVDSSHRQQPTHIHWFGVPNQAMVPVNDMANRIHRAFLDSIGEKEVAQDLGPMRVTAGGLAIIKGPPSMIGNGEAQHTGGGRMHDTSRGLAIVGRGAPAKAVETNILGSVFPAARQNP